QGSPLIKNIEVIVIDNSNEKNLESDDENIILQQYFWKAKEK
ncbi:1002_t:CDS:1, partial [Racocetra persica]